MKNIFLTVCLLISLISGMQSQPTYSRDIAPIIYKHCANCHRTGEIGPMPLTNYTQVKNWANTIRFVTQNKMMPPWKADPGFSRFLDENFLTDEQIKTIADWVTAGTPQGNPADEPPFPLFPDNSQLGTPDLVLSFAKSHIHKGNGKDEYRYFVLPTGLTENKRIKAIELRPGNKKIVHHALFFADTTGIARSYDDQTPEYGFEGFGGFGVNEVLNRDQFPGYVPGQKPIYFPDGLAQILPKGSDLVIQMHYAPWAVDEADSSSVNIFFARPDEPINRIVDDYIMLPFHLLTGANSFFIPANTKKTFEGVYTLPFDVSLIGIFPHMHYLGKHWEVYMIHPNGARENLIKIPDWDFNWQGNYYFDRFKVAKKGTRIHAIASYDNTSSNPNNPSSPPRFVTWGEGSKDEMYYLPLLYVPYRQGDENVIFSGTSSVREPESITPTEILVYPNPGTGELTQIQFSLEQGQAITIEIRDIHGALVRILRQGEYYGPGRHAIQLHTASLSTGNYLVHMHGQRFSKVMKLVLKR
ncbi:MAG: T9SS type A sorting domain-containing protein [Saprospiraceae bacterium]|nr:T9SS type A sorting domain-containing protein [Saprospiraceae bacterium]